MNWLRVLRSAEVSRVGQGVGQQRHTRAARSEKCVVLRGRCGMGMRVNAAFFGLRTPPALPSHISVFSHYFNRLDRFTKLATSSVVIVIMTTKCTTKKNDTLVRQGHDRVFQRMLFFSRCNAHAVWLSLSRLNH